MCHIIFLHGLLGDKTDWLPITTEPLFRSSKFRLHCIDLPFHGESKEACVEHFSDANHYLSNIIRQTVHNDPYILVGYSLGGRLALSYSLSSHKDRLLGVILEGVNLGLSNQQEKEVRWKNDVYWADRFISEEIRYVLNDWYQQPVFSHLTELQRTQLIKKRSSNCGKSIGKMLLATSLAKQPDFSLQVRSNPLPFFYFCGEQDSKFKEIAERNRLNTILIPNAGHNSHLENPAFFTRKLIEISNTLIEKL